MDATACDKLWTMIHGIRFAMVTTRSADGALRSRPLTTQNRSLDPQDPVLWFFVSRDSEVAADAAAEEALNVAYADTDNDRYISIEGRVQLVNDRIEAEKLWSFAAKAWFPGGPADADLRLLRVAVDRAEYWDTKSSKMVQLLKMMRAAASGERPTDIGEHRAVSG